ncbi:MAG: FmdE family protein [Spirochaetota bacterium]|jgi:formylmethanofuran dehydrogenase subunit E
MERICDYTTEEFIKKLSEFHGNFAPGLLIGGFMVDIATRNMEQYEFFDAICESPACLPDAIQMLTPCTVGNGWLKIVDTGRFAISFYEKKTGKGVRVYLDANRLEPYAEIKNWFMRLTTKQEQDKDALIAQILQAGKDIYAMKDVVVSENYRGKHIPSSIAICSNCGEAYPQIDGNVCLACQGMNIYQ